MTIEEVDLLLTPLMREAVENNLHRDPLEVALDKKLQHALLVAGQVKYLRRAKSKLPSYYRARCVIPSLAFEQSSGEKAASAVRWRGGTCLDLTCGLGVDALALSRDFERVITIERDPVLAYTARRNFELLGAQNIEVAHAAAEEFLTANPGLEADLVFADPDRRALAGKRSVRVEDSSPDMIGLLPVLREITPLLAVKLSPLFDVDEVFRIFGPRSGVTVVSVGGECKQLIAESGPGFRGPVVCAAAVDKGNVCYPYDKSDAAEEPVNDQFSPAGYRYMVVPDVALQKAGLARRYFAERGYRIETDNSYAFSREKPEGIIGTIFEIGDWFPYHPAGLSRILKERGIGRAEILKRAFPYSTGQICRDLKIREGGAVSLAFTVAGGKNYVLFVSPVR